MNNDSLFNYARLASQCVCVLTASAATHVRSVSLCVGGGELCYETPSGLVSSDWLVLTQTMS